MERVTAGAALLMVAMSDTEDIINSDLKCVARYMLATTMLTGKAVHSIAAPSNISAGILGVCLAYWIYARRAAQNTAQHNALP